MLYRGELLMRVTSGTAFVDLRRAANGRITSITDDLGRGVEYRYDEAGALVEVQDLADQSWHFQYAGGKFTTIIDPRRKTTLAATYDAAGRVTSIRVLQSGTTFQYTATTTRAVDALGRATTFYRQASGLTDAIADPSGALTQITFDTELRPIAVARNGAPAARMSYDPLGRLQSLSLGGEQSSFIHGPHGIVSVGRGQTVARYRYDSQGRVVHAADSMGERAYRFEADGRLSGITLDGQQTELAAGPDGVITGVARRDRQLAEYRHDASGRLTSIAYGDGEYSASYVYDQRGFREAANYGHGISLRLAYDSAGNMIHHALDMPDNKTLSQHYEIGDYNEVLRIRSGGTEAHGADDVSFRYDEVGRMFNAQAGGRSASVIYDDLDRVKQIILDGRPLVEYDYPTQAVDAVARTDRRTGEVITGPGVSNVFGTMASIVYTRLRSTTFGPVDYAPEQKAFRVHAEYLTPDAVLLSSLDRRMIPIRGGGLDPRPFGYDKPSNSLFIPPEYRSVNCYICSGNIQSVEIRVPPQGTVAGKPVDIEITADGGCYIIYLPGSEATIASMFPLEKIEWEFGGGTAPSPFLHRIDFGDGSSTTAFTGSPELTRTHTYQSEGTYTISDVISCLFCESLLGVVRAEAVIEVEDPTPPAVGISVGAPNYYIDNRLNMPQMVFEAELQNTDVPVAEVDFRWRLNLRYGSPGNNVNEWIPPGGGTSNIRGGTWTPNWGRLLSGGNVTVYVSAMVNGEPTPEVSQSGYVINGQNPTKSQIGAIAGSPWFLTRMISEESSCRQFSPDPGPPLKSFDDGYGLMQITNLPPTNDEIWNWRDNISGGKGILSGKRSQANAFWARQLEQWRDYNEPLDEDMKVGPPPDKTYGNVTFSYDGGGRPPVDGIEIKLYNGAGDGNWLVWKNNDNKSPRPYWPYNDSGGYVRRVVTSSPCQ